MRSEWLPELHHVASFLPELAPFVEGFLRINLVLDANIVQEELQWRVKRRNPEARTKLSESAVSGVVVLFAPSHLICEIGDHLHEIAARAGCTLEKVRFEWDDFRKLLHFLAPSETQLHAGVPIADPDDLPYVAAREFVGADAVYSRDKHLRDMRAPVVSVFIDASLQTYARASSVQVAFMVGSAFSVRVSMTALKAVGEAITKLYEGFRRLHPVLQAAIVATLIYVFVDETLRTRFLSFLKWIGQRAAPVVDALVAAAEQLEISRIALEKAEEEIIAVLPARKRIPLIVRARRLCIVSGKPIPLRELEMRILADGYKTNSTQFSRYLRRVLRTSDEFVESPAGWRLIAAKLP